MLRRSILSVGALLLAASGATTATAQPAARSRKLTPEDDMEIRALYATYCHALDKGLGELFASVWTDDGEFTGGRGPGRGAEVRTPRKGKAALTTMGNTSGTRHFNTNLLLTPTAEGAKGTCYLLLYTARTNPPTFVETAIYDDTLVRTPQGWKFKKRIVWRDDDDITPFKPMPARG